jgi:hypothetical protein
MTLVVLIADLLMAPWRKYYHFEDPLLKAGMKAGASDEGDGNDVSFIGTDLEKQKYT